VVTSVAIDAGVKPSADAANTAVTRSHPRQGKKLPAKSVGRKRQSAALPFPPPEIDPVLALVLKNSDLVAALDQETLQVRSLTAGSYDLLIDGRKIGSFTADQLASGINLATMETPMLEQARLVAFDTEKVIFWNRSVSKSSVVPRLPSSLATAQALADAYPIAVGRQRADAQPLTHHYDLVLASPAPRAID